MSGTTTNACTPNLPGVHVRVPAWALGGEESGQWQELGDTRKPTIRIGLAVSPPQPLETLIAAADRALYDAKGAGRSRVAG